MRVRDVRVSIKRLFRGGEMTRRRSLFVQTNDKCKTIIERNLLVDLIKREGILLFLLFLVLIKREGILHSTVSTVFVYGLLSNV